jgi:hypothetical protein
MTTDRERPLALLDALDGSETTLQRDMVRGEGRTGDWGIRRQKDRKGNDANVIYPDGDGYLIYVTKPEHDRIDPDDKRRCYGSPRRWASIKKALGFARLVQEAEDEGIFHMDRLPNEAEAEAIREAVGIRKRRIVTDAARSQLQAMRQAAKSGFASRQSI